MVWYGFGLVGGEFLVHVSLNSIEMFSSCLLIDDYKYPEQLLLEQVSFYNNIP